MITKQILLVDVAVSELIQNFGSRILKLLYITINDVLRYRAQKTKLICHINNQDLHC